MSLTPRGWIHRSPTLERVWTKEKKTNLNSSIINITDEFLKQSSTMRRFRLAKNIWKSPRSISSFRFNANILIQNRKRLSSPLSCNPRGSYEYLIVSFNRSIVYLYKNSKFASLTLWETLLGGGASSSNTGAKYRRKSNVKVYNVSEGERRVSLLRKQKKLDAIKKIK